MSLMCSKVQNSLPERTRTRPNDARQIKINHVWCLTLNFRARVLEPRKIKTTRFPNGIRALFTHEAFGHNMRFCRRALSCEVPRTDLYKFGGEKALKWPQTAWIPKYLTHLQEIWLRIHLHHQKSAFLKFRRNRQTVVHVQKRVLESSRMIKMNIRTHWMSTAVYSSNSEKWKVSRCPQ